MLALHDYSNYRTNNKRLFPTHCFKKKTIRGGATSFCKYYLCSKPLQGLIGMDVMHRPGVYLGSYTTISYFYRFILKFFLLSEKKTTFEVTLFIHSSMFTIFNVFIDRYEGIIFYQENPDMPISKKRNHFKYGMIGRKQKNKAFLHI